MLLTHKPAMHKLVCFVAIEMEAMYPVTFDCMPVSEPKSAGGNKNWFGLVLTRNGRRIRPMYELRVLPVLAVSTFEATTQVT